MCLYALTITSMDKILHFINPLKLLIEQIKGNVLTITMESKETIIHECFRQKLPSLGARRQTTKEEGSIKKRIDKKELT